MKQTMRWYGPNDPVSLSDINQAGATGIVTALHHISNGEIWPVDELLKRKAIIEEKQELSWAVIESIPIHEDIKTHSGEYNKYIENYQQSIRNVAKAGIDTICYNFMPVLDWTRTDLAFELPNGAKALRYDHIAVVVFDVFILRRENAAKDYSDDELKEAESYFANMTEDSKKLLISNIIAGLPGAEEGYTLEQFRNQLSKYNEIDKDKFRENYAYFLRAVIPVAEEVGVVLAVHPDDPPRTLLGIPRIVSNIEDMAWLKNTYDSIHNGFTMCVGSYGACKHNDLVKMIKTFADRIHFAHLRSTRREKNPLSFYEADHLDGDLDMFAVVQALIEEENKRQMLGNHREIYVRPDHGHQMLDDLHKTTNPGYSAIGRLKGLAEFRGLEMGIRRGVFNEQKKYIKGY